MNTAENTAPVYLAPDRFVTVGVYARISGVTERAIRMKIQSGKWIERRDYVRAPDGGIFIDRQGVQKWIFRGG